MDNFVVTNGTSDKHLTVGSAQFINLTQTNYLELDLQFYGSVHCAGHHMGIRCHLL